MDIMILFKSLIFLSVLCSMFLFGYVYNRRVNSISHRFLSGFLLANLMYASSYFFEISSDTLTQIKLALNLEYLGILFIPMFWVLIAWAYHPDNPVYNEKLLKKLRILYIIPILSNIIVWTNDLHHWVYVHIGLNTDQSISLLSVERGPGFWVINGIMIVLFFVGSIRMITNLIKSIGNHRKQYLLLTLAGTPPFLSYILILRQVIPYNLDINPIAFALSCILLFWGMYNLQLFNILPIAQKLVIDAIPDIMIVLNPKGCLIEYNIPATQLFEKDNPDLFNIPLKDLYPYLSSLLCNSSDSYEIDLTMPNSEEIRTYSIFNSPIIDRKNRLRGNLYLLHELTEIKKYMKELEYLAASDGLTNLLNHREFMKMANMEAQRLGEKGFGQFSIIMIDLDKFKMINDEYGHSAGDKVLQQLGLLIPQQVRPTDICARYGGEEFILLLYDTTLEQATSYAEKLRLAIEKTDFMYNGNKLNITGSFGVSTFSPELNASWEITLNHADSGLYMAKKAGRNKVHAM